MPGASSSKEPVVVRPTSETIINSFFSRWVQSHRDLPMKLNNWSNVVRWEMRPRVFLRTTEFLWQEGHTCHVNEAEARAHAWEVLDDVYGAFMTGVLAIPVIKGRKTARERFAGAINTLTCEAMMGDGKALQMGTSHELGQNFARAFDVQYLAASGQRKYVWQTSWGVSTRMVGGLIMCHGDDAGLRVPPRLAPVQVLVLVSRTTRRSGPGRTRSSASFATPGFAWCSTSSPTSASGAEPSTPNSRGSRFGWNSDPAMSSQERQSWPGAFRGPRNPWR